MTPIWVVTVLHHWHTELRRWTRWLCDQSVNGSSVSFSGGAPTLPYAYPLRIPQFWLRLVSSPIFELNWCAWEEARLWTSQLEIKPNSRTGRLGKIWNGFGKLGQEPKLNRYSVLMREHFNICRNRSQSLILHSFSCENRSAIDMMTHAYWIRIPFDFFQFGRFDIRKVSGIVGFFLQPSSLASALALNRWRYAQNSVPHRLESNW